MKNFSDFVNIMNELNFSEFYSNNIQFKSYSMNYGQRGVLSCNGVLPASEEYNNFYLYNPKYSVNIDSQLPINKESDDHSLILSCIEIFDWGDVQKSNIIDAIDLHRKSELKSYLLRCKTWFEDDNCIDCDLEEITWSSGWTKVYSFTCDYTTIFDSRVAAFIGYIFVEFSKNLSSEEKNNLKKITSKLISFSGNGSRKRFVAKEHRELLEIKRRSITNHQAAMISNKLASWFLRYITTIEFGEEYKQSDFRAIDKAFFLLGFDIAQIDSNTDFE